MPRYKVTIGLSRSVYSPSESYITPVVSATNLSAKLNTLIEKRNALLYNTVEWIGIRIGQIPTDANDPSQGRRSAVYPPGSTILPQGGVALVVPELGAIASANKQERPDQAKASLISRLTFDDDRRVVRYISFPPDKVLFDEPLSFLPSNFPAWEVSWNTFCAELSSGGWSIRARNNGTGFAPIKIIQWVQTTPNATPLGVVIPNADAAGMTQGRMIQIKSVRRKGTDRTSYNGKYFIDSVNNTFATGLTAIYLRATETGVPASIKLPGTIQIVNYYYAPITVFSGVKAGTHKRGNSFGRPVGKRKTRVSLDP